MKILILPARLQRSGQAGWPFDLHYEVLTHNAGLKEAVIRDFWNEGEDKIVFWKKL